MNIRGILAILLLLCVGCQSLPHASSTAPKITVYKTKESFRLAPTQPYWLGPLILDEETLCYKKNKFGGPYCNPSNYALVTLPNNIPNYENRKTNLPADCSQVSPLTPLQEKGLERLEATALLLGAGVTWNYNYDNQVNDYVVKAPYSSAFAQAAAIHALLFGHCKQPHNKKWLELATLAGRGLIVPIHKGGMRNGVFFEEQPAPDGYTPWILNGHMYSVAMLYALHHKTGERKFKQAAEQGVEWLKDYAHLYDTGQWTRYSARPRSGYLYFELHYTSETKINRVELKSGESVWTVCETGCNKTPAEVSNGLSWRMAGNLPSLRHFSLNETISINVEHEGPAPQIISEPLRPGMNAPTRSNLGETLPIEHMAWSTLNVEYQTWHTFLAHELALWSQDPHIRRLWHKWDTQLQNFKAIK